MPHGNPSKPVFSGCCLSTAWPCRCIRMRHRGRRNAGNRIGVGRHTSCGAKLFADTRLWIGDRLREYLGCVENWASADFIVVISHSAPATNTTSGSRCGGESHDVGTSRARLSGQQSSRHRFGRISRRWMIVHRRIVSLEDLASEELGVGAIAAKSSTDDAGMLAVGKTAQQAGIANSGFTCPTQLFERFAGLQQARLRPTAPLDRFLRHGDTLRSRRRTFVARNTFHRSSIGLAREG